MKLVLNIISYYLLAVLINAYYLLKGLVNTFSKFPWIAYDMLRPFQGLNIHFYKSRNLERIRNGVTGRSKFLGLGDFNLARTFYYSSFALKAFSKNTVAFVIISWAIFNFNCLLFYFQSGELSQLLIFFIIILSCYSYNNLVSQNYNYAAWIFLPLLYYSFVSSNIYLFALSAFLIAGLSLSAWVAVILTLGAFLFINFNWSYFLVLLSSSVVIIIQIIPLLLSSERNEILDKIKAAIGLKKTNVKYVRTKLKEAKPRMIKAFVVLPHILICGFLIYSGHSLALLYIFTSLLILANFFAFRFLDDQSCYTLWLSLLPCIVYFDPSWILLLLIYLAINPLPIILNLKADNYLKLPKLQTLNSKKLYNAFDKFFERVPKDNRVFIAFDDPGRDYEKVFNGMRVLIELPHFVATRREIHLFPEWWSVFELNYPESESVWANSVSELNKMCEKWNANYYIVNSKSQVYNEMDNIEEDCIAKLNWADYEELVQDKRLQKTNLPKWYLMTKN